VHLVTKETDYAVRALLLLAKTQERFVASREIAARQQIPLPYLRSVLGKLKREKIIECREGIKGGARLAQSPKTITLFALVRIFQGNLSLTGCLFGRKLCGNQSFCPLRKRLLAIETTVAKELGAITLAHLMDR